MEEPKLIQVALIYDKKQNPMNGRVYDTDGIAPTLRTPTGGLSEPCILGYTRDDKGNVKSYHEKEIAGTIHTSSGNGGNTDQFVQEPCIIQRPHGYFDGGETDIAPTVKASAYADNNLLKEQVIGSMQANAMHGSIDGVSPCLTEAMGMGGGQIPMVTIRYRIRKLTPRECFRLMDLDDADIDKIDAYRIKTTLKDGTVKEKPISKSAKYCCAGNSICVNVLYHIFRCMFIAEPPKPQPKQLSLFD